MYTYITHIAGITISLTLAVLSYQYLVWLMFYIGLSRFYDLASEVPEQCAYVVTEAAIAFTGVYDFISLTLSALFVIVAVYIAWHLYVRVKSV